MIRVECTYMYIDPYQIHFPETKLSQPGCVQTISSNDSKEHFSYDVLVVIIVWQRTSSNTTLFQLTCLFFVFNIDKRVSSQPDSLLGLTLQASFVVHTNE